MTFAVGSLVRKGIHLGLEKVEGASLKPPSADDLGDFRSGRLLRDAIRLGFRSNAGPFRSFGRIACEPRPYQLVPLLMALRLDPDQPPLWSALGRCLLERGLPPNAVQVLETAVFLRPADGVAWARLGCAYFETGRHAEAARAFARGFETGGDEPWFWYWAGQNAAALGDRESLERARKELKERDAELLRELETRVEALATKAAKEGPCHSPSVPTAG